MSRTFVVVTDGYIAEETAMFEYVRKHLGEANVFSFGIGSAVNRHLTDGIAKAGQGESFVVLDQAAWHTTDKLRLPANVSLLPLPPKSPELNPAENVWQFLRQTKLSNRIFDDYEAVVDAACQAWNSLTDDPGRIKSIGTRSWAIIGQH